MKMLLGQCHGVLFILLHVNKLFAPVALSVAHVLLCLLNLQKTETKLEPCEDI